MRALSDMALSVLVGFVIYIIILSAFYGSDKVKCAKYGYSNKITPTLEGYCTKEIADGVSIFVPVEDIGKIKRNSMHGKRGWRN